MITAELAVSAPPEGATDDFARLLERVAEQADMFNRQGHVDRDTVGYMKRAGFYRALLPARFGGDERSPAQFLQMIERVAQVDGSAAWVSSFGVSHLYLASLPEATLEKVYTDYPDLVFAGGLFPPQPAEEVEGGFIVSGTWRFGSGSPGAGLIGVGIRGGASGGPNALPRVAVMPADKVTIVPNWDVIGMRGTGSYDLVVDKVFVPEEMTFIRGSAPSVDEPLYRYPSMAMAAQVLAVVGLGVARAAIDSLSGFAGGRKSITGAPVMANRAHVQIALAKAEAQLRSSRAYFYEVTEAVYADILAGKAVTREQAGLLRLAASHAARTGLDVTRLIFDQCGTAGIFNSHPLSRMLADATVVASHAFMTEGTWQSAGCVLLGLETPAGYP